MARRGDTQNISNDLRDRYYFIDYLRLHRYGRDNEIWKKNRNMLVREHEYSDSSETKARKGYKSYIQRCMKSILDTMYPDFNIIKPRNVFGYEIGQKNDEGKDLLDLGIPEDRIKLLLSRYIESGDNAEAVTAYRDAVLSSGRVSFKNREAGLTVKLDNERSFGYQAVKELTEIKETQDTLLGLAENLDKTLASLVVQGVEKTYRIPNGNRVQKVRYGRLEGIFGTVISSVNSSSNTNNAIRYTVQWDNQQGQGTSETSPAQVKLVFGELIGEAEESMTATVTPLLDRVIQYANDNFGGTTGLDRGTIFNLARGAIVREILDDGDMHTAGVVRQIEANSATLERITITNYAEDDEGEEEDEEFFDDNDNEEW